MSAIRRLLIANRGEIACRIARTCRRLGVETVAVFSDADAGALHVAQCDEAVRLQGDAPADTYLRIDLLVAAAARTGADAVHPGYGFLAESAAFAGAVGDAGLTWVGPPSGAIAAMGSKIAAKERMRAAGVPVLAEGPDAGFPLVVKASAGGGGRGMRVVREPGELEAAIEAASREAEAAFGDGAVFCERYVERGRHVEVQVFGDAHGTVVALHERECSIQRRHQKIIEEAPSPAVDAGLRAAMTQAAVAAARAVGYVGAGTVEFLLEPDGRFSFLEMNTRLQVEHTVTEAITGLDLVEWQLRVAEGEPLPPDLLAAPIGGHAVEARLTAEDPAAGYRPATGTLTRFDLPATPPTAFSGVLVNDFVHQTSTESSGATIRVDSGVAAGSVVSPHYDSLLAKVIAWAPTRAAAIRALRTALDQARIAGVATNRDQLVNVLDHPAFRAGDIHTAFLDDDPCATPRTGDVSLALAAAWHADDALVVTPPGVPVGWRNNRAVERTRTYRHGADEIVVRESELTATIAQPVTMDPDGLAHVVLDRDGHCLPYTVHRDGGRLQIDGPRSHVAADVVARHPEPATASARSGSLTATMPGAVRRVNVAIGDTVTAGQAVIVIEAMKMEHEVIAPADGTVTAVLVAAGDQVANGDPLLAID